MRFLAFKIIASLLRLFYNSSEVLEVEEYAENVVTSVDQIENNTTNMIVVKTASGKNVVLKVVPSEQVQVSEKYKRNKRLGD